MKFVLFCVLVMSFIDLISGYGATGFYIMLVGFGIYCAIVELTNLVYELMKNEVADILEEVKNIYMILPE